VSAYPGCPGREAVKPGVCLSLEDIREADRVKDGCEVGVRVWLQVLKHNYFAVGQNLLTSRQPSSVTQHVNAVTASPQKVLHPSQQQQQQGGGAGDDDWQQTVSALQTPGHAPLGHAAVMSSKPLTKQMSKDLFPWLSEPDQKNVAAQPVLPHIAQKASPLKVCTRLALLLTTVVVHIQQSIQCVCVSVYMPGQ